jgi:hypothetical protein
MDVARPIRRSWMPAIHAGMTEPQTTNATKFLPLRTMTGRDTRDVKHVQDTYQLSRGHNQNRPRHCQHAPQITRRLSVSTSRENIAVRTIIITGFELTSGSTIITLP